MVSVDSVEKQLKKLKFNLHGWGRTEAGELPNILMVDEEIYEVVNGLYDGGFALLVATNIRVLLVDKKPLNYLTVEDFRFDMINEIDYNHRLLGAHINLSAGNKSLKFTSYNQVRLRKLITHVQHCIADTKKEQTTHAVDQKQHLEQINQQLQAYLLAQHQQQQQFQQQITQSKEGITDPVLPNLAPLDAVKPSPELSDYLFAQSLLAQYKADEAKQKFANVNGDESRLNAGEYTTTPAIPAASVQQAEVITDPQQVLPPVAQQSVGQASSEMAELYAEGMQEIYGKREQPQQGIAAEAAQPVAQTALEASDLTPPSHVQQISHLLTNPLEINPLKIAYSKLPMALRNKRFGRPSFHSHSQAPIATSAPQPIPEA